MILDLQERGDKSEEKHLTQNCSGPAAVDARRGEQEENSFSNPGHGV
jgi:hypothetical protein